MLNISFVRKAFVTAFVVLIAAFNCHAQKPKSKDSLADPQNIKVTTTREPAYPKGEQALYSDVLYGIKYSDEAKKKYFEGEVTLSFEVRTDSTVFNARIISDGGYGTGEEVKKFVEKLKFTPALQMGKPVKMKVMITFPVKAH